MPYHRECQGSLIEDLADARLRTSPAPRGLGKLRREAADVALRALVRAG